MSWGSGWVSRILCQISLGVPTVCHRSFSLFCEKTLPKNELRFRAELPEYGVKFRLKYACTSALIFLVLRKNTTEKWFEVWGWDSRIRRQISLEVRLYVCAYFPCLAKKHHRKMIWGSGWVSRKTSFLAPCGMHIRRWGFCCEEMRGKPEYNLQIKACFVGCGEPLGAICNLRNSQKG